MSTTNFFNITFSFALRRLCCFAVSETVAIYRFKFISNLHLYKIKIIFFAAQINLIYFRLYWVLFWFFWKFLIWKTFSRERPRKKIAILDIHGFSKAHASSPSCSSCNWWNPSRRPRRHLVLKRRDGFSYSAESGRRKAISLCGRRYTSTRKVSLEKRAFIKTIPSPSTSPFASLST